MTRRFWSEAELAYLREHYAETSAAEIACALGTTERRVYFKAAALGLKKSAEYMSRVHGARAREVGALTRFKPGMTPGYRIPKGTRVSPATEFKAGHQPHTWKPVGSYRINADGYLDRKVGDTGYPPRDWIAVHRLVWIEAYGPIPEGHIVAFKPGRRTTELEAITTDALELVSRAEMLRRNSLHRLPAPLRELVRLRGRITREINAREKDSA